MKQELTDTFLKGLVVLRPTTVWDAKVPGLMLRASPTAKGFALAYKVGRKNRTIALGKFPEVSLATARKRALDLRAEIRGGADPVEDRRREAVVGVTLADVAHRYLAARAPHVAPKTLREYRGHVAKLGKKISNRPAAELQRHDLRDALDIVAAERGDVTRNRTCSLLQSALAWGVDEGLIPRDPSRGLEQLPEDSHHRALTDEELRAVWTSSASAEQLAYVRVLLLLGLRRTEAALARWADVQGETLVMPAENRKGRRGQKRALVVPLPKLALEVLPARGANDELIFGQRVLGDPHRTVVDLRKASGVSFTWHDCRTTFASGLATLKVAPHVIASLLGHSSRTIALAGAAPAVTAIYTQSERTAEMKIALDAWATHVAGLVA
jgi:integrase